jgi:hypothetical protein
MASTVGFFYANVTYRGNRAVVLVAEDPKQGWKLMNPGGVRWWLNKPDAHQGPWRPSATTFNGLVECLSSSGMAVVFNLGNIEFPPDINNNASWFRKIFTFGDYWKANDASLPKVRTASDGANWSPVITSQLLQDVTKKFEQIQEEIKQIAIQAGIDVASILDPTPFTSFVGSGYALRRGDYLGCAISLLGAIPMIGELAKAGKAAAIEAKLTKLTQELNFFKRAIEESTVATREARLTGSVIDPAIQGTTKAAGAAKSTAIFKDVTTGPALAKVAEEGGMSTKDATALRDFSMDNDAISIVRYTAKESLARRMDPLNTGKPCELADFHTAHGNSQFSGYIVIKDDQMSKFVLKDEKGQTWTPGTAIPSTGLFFDKASLKGYKVMPAKCSATGDRLICKDGKAFYSDYDFMGIYHAKNGHAYEDFKALNDNKGIVSFMQNMFHGSGYGNKVKHGMQDFFIKWLEVAGPKGSAGAKMAVQGRQPKLDELFVVFEATGKVSILNLQQLRMFYNKYKMHWPYDAFKQMTAKL